MTHAIIPLTTTELAMHEIRNGLNPHYVAAAYLSNAEDMKGRIIRVKAKIEKTGKADAKVAGYTLEMCEASIARCERSAVEVPNRMREIHADYPRLIQLHPMCEYQKNFAEGTKL